MLILYILKHRVMMVPEKNKLFKISGNRDYQTVLIVSEQLTEGGEAETINTTALEHFPNLIKAVKLTILY